MTSWDIVFLLHDASRTNFYLVTNDDSFMRLYLQLTFKQVPASSVDAGDSFHKRFPNRFIMCHSSPKLKRTRISRFSRRLSRPPRRWASHTFCRTPPRSSSYSVIYGLLCHSVKSQLWNWVMADWKGRPWSLSTPHPHPSSQYSLCALSSLSLFFFFCHVFFPMLLFRHRYRFVVIGPGWSSWQHCQKMNFSAHPWLTPFVARDSIRTRRSL